MHTIARVLPLFLGAILVSAAANAATLTIVNAGGGNAPRLVGATGVEVNGSLYDVTFLQGGAIDIFGVRGTPSEQPFDFTTVIDATAAGQALLEQVFIDIPGGPAFDSLPGDNWAYRSTYSIADETFSLSGPNQCQDNADCEVLIGYGLDESSRPLSVIVRNSQTEQDDGLSTGTFNGGVATWADFTYVGPATVPLPAGVLLLATGLGALAVARHAKARRA